MRSVLRLGVIAAVISLVFGQLNEDNNEATHIIKFKNALDYTAASNELLAHHRNFLSSVRNVNVVQMDTNQTSGFSAASSNEQVMSLDHINLGPDFSAVAGVFDDHAFLEYLYEQSSVEYVEINQAFKSTTVIYTTTKDKNVEKRQEDNIMEEEEQVQEVHEVVKEVIKEDQYISNIKSAKPANWGLARINQHEKGNLDTYQYDTSGGAGIDVYVLDTGVYADHLDFGGRATYSANFIRTESDVDMGGHGTHVSGKIAGTEYGVAKSVNIRSVKILNKLGDGSTSSLLKGIEHVVKYAVPGKSLVNLSLSGPRSRMLDEALNSLVIKHKIPVFVSAGNAGTDACFFSPSSNPNVFVVGASDINDAVPRFSNVGECVHIYAPGANIVSTYIGGVDSSKSMDGTSMASPHVAGIAANLLAKKSFDTVQQLYDEIKSIATKNAINFDASKTTSPSINLLAFNQV